MHSISLLILAVALTSGVAFVAPNLSWPIAASVLSLVLGSLGIGRAALGVLRTPARPLLAFVTGYALIANAMFAIGQVAPHALLLAGLLPIGIGLALLPTQRKCPPPSWTDVRGAMFAAAFTAIWCWDNSRRLAMFYRSGELRFWLDVLFHSAEFSSIMDPKAVGRGLPVLVDGPARIYHYASYFPAALIGRVADMPALDLVVLVWMPLGVLVMACGIMSLGSALAPRGWLGILGLAAIAFLPAPERTTLGNGALGFAWLLETAPGTPYSIGIACAALAMLVYAWRERRSGPILGALLLTSCCLFIRANTFVWLAPSVALGAVPVWNRIPASRRLSGVMVGYAALLCFLVLLSFRHISEAPAEFLFGYSRWALTANAPTHMDFLLPWLEKGTGGIAAGLFGVPLVLLGTSGAWLLAFGAAWWQAARAGRLTPVDFLPVVILGVAAAMVILGPDSPNGDSTEFRHRPGPLLVPVLAVWTLDFMRRTSSAAIRARWGARVNSVAVALASASLVVLLTTISDAKKPRHAWGRNFYGTTVSPDLVGIARMLASTGAEKPSLVVANQPADARHIDDALRLAALSGVPAYISCPAFLVASGGRFATEAERRVQVVRRLEQAPDTQTLRTLMRGDGITHYVVTVAQARRFDPLLHDVSGRSGNLAVYEAAESATR